MDRGDGIGRQESPETLSGTVTAIIYQSPDTGYTVLRLDIGGDGEPVTAVGVLPYLAPGEGLHIEGAWTSHPSYGSQFKIQRAERALPDTERALYDYLASGAVRGVGPATARAIVDQFGEKALEVMEEHPEQLSILKGITIKRAREIGVFVRRQTALRLLIAFLTRHRLPPGLAIKLYQYFGENALAALRDDPYLLADPELGGDFPMADAFALSLGVEGDSAQRIMAATQYTLGHNLQNGHSFIPRDKLVSATAGLLSLSPDLCEDALDRLIDGGRVVQDSLRGTLACYLEHIYQAEEAVARKIRQMAAYIPQGKADVTSLLAELEAADGITYAPEQREAVIQAAEGNVLVLTGAPGTGKTTAVRAILGLFDRMGLRTLLGAPTGRAAKRMSELTRREAQTIHRLLGAGYAGEEKTALHFERDEENPLEAEAVILDEASMVDILLMRATVAALPPGCRLVLVGDVDQLPSVGPGNVFSDFIRSDIVPVVRLTEIFRQAKESGIIRLAHSINRGEGPDFTKKERDLFFLQRRDPGKTVETVIDLVARRLPENMGIESRDIQVLSPFKRGEAGTIRLNTCLQAALNPKSDKKSERMVGDFVLRPGDRVMQIRNNYDILWKYPDGSGGQGVFNGDIGQIVAIDPKEGSVTVDFEGRQAVYLDEIGELEPAWAMTVHKSQGSEYRAVVFVVEKGPSMLLARKVLYTGVTRARELLILVGDGKILDIMIQNNRQQKRYSGLKLRLTGE